MTAHTHSPESDAQFEAMARELVARGAVEGTMFGCRTLFHDRTMVAVLYNTQLAVRLGRNSATLQELFRAGKATHWDPTKEGRPFLDWAVVDMGHRKLWSRLAEQAWTALSG